MVIIKNQEQIDGIRKSCQLLAGIMKEVVSAVKPGVTTKELNAIAEKMIFEAGAKPAFKGYKAYPSGVAFPSSLCSSINEIVVHGTSESTEPLKEGDVIGLDLGTKLNGYYSDMAVTVQVGVISPETTQLLEVTRQSLENGIAQMKPGNKIRQISKAIEDTISPHKYGIVKEFVGHGVGLEVHEDPRIPNYVSGSLEEDLDIELRPGMVLAVEPMVNLGGDKVRILDDGWSVSTIDGSVSAHYEHTVLITEAGHEILTA